MSTTIKTKWHRESGRYPSQYKANIGSAAYIITQRPSTGRFSSVSWIAAVDGSSYERIGNANTLAEAKSYCEEHAAKASAR